MIINNEISGITKDIKNFLAKESCEQIFRVDNLTPFQIKEMQNFLRGQNYSMNVVGYWSDSNGEKRQSAHTPYSVRIKHSKVSEVVYT